ncbi:hypothetical protein ACQ4PT_021419 [Festuca glaucescens]
MQYSPKQLAAVLLLALASAMIVTAQDTVQEILDAHNTVRANVGVPPVTWDDTVATYAEAFAQKRSADCLPEFSPLGHPYGENVFVGTGSEWNMLDAVNWWVAQKQYYDHATNTCSAPSGQSCAAKVSSMMATLACISYATTARRVTWWGRLHIRLHT